VEHGERDQAGHFRPGASGNPAGRPPSPRLALPPGWDELERHERIAWLLETAIAGKVTPADAGKLARLIEAAMPATVDPDQRPDPREVLIARVDELAREAAMDPRYLLEELVDDPRWPDLVASQPLWAEIAATYGLPARPA
jgi:hypothetical protein